MKEIKKVCVAGGGRMGRQIALCSAIHGYETVVWAHSEKTYNAVLAWEEEYLAGRIQKGRMTEEQVAATKSRFSVERDLAKALEGADLVIEAIVEVVDEKRELFKQISDIVPEDTLIVTNSSAMVSSLFADCVKNPSRLCNMHFYNPALVMTFVEVVQGAHTAPETAQAAYEWCKSIGKKPAWQKKEIDGFIGNYIYGGASKRAKYLVENGYCSWQDCDLAMEEGFHWPMGVFRLNDFTGIDLSYDMMTAAYKKTGVKPDMYDIYAEMVKNGRLGKGRGGGFYDD